MKMNQLSCLVAIGFSAFAMGCSDDGGDGGTGGSSGSGGNTTGEELVNGEGWVGEDPLSADDNPKGIQGAWYVFGDGNTCGSLQELMDTKPCTATGCCLDGHTFGDKDYTLHWGCGIGLSLNDSGGDAPVKNAYVGSSRAFKVAISGNTGKNPIRIGFTQAQDTTGLVSPYLQIDAVEGTAEQEVSFDTATYPSWCSNNPGCMGLQGQKADPAKAYDIQFQIPGGDLDADFNYCITSLQAL